MLETRPSNQTTSSEVQEPDNEMQQMQNSIRTLEQQNEEHQRRNDEQQLRAQALVAFECRLEEQITALRDSSQSHDGAKTPQGYSSHS